MEIVLSVISSLILDANSLIILSGESPTWIGRQHSLQQEDFRLQIKEADISRTHCKIYWNNGCFYIMDLKSSFGTRLNGSLVLKPQPLANGDILRIGSTFLQIHNHLKCHHCDWSLHPIIITTVAKSTEEKKREKVPTVRPIKSRDRKIVLKRSIEKEVAADLNAYPKVKPIDRPLDPLKNKGAAMLLKLGWQPGDSLGVGDDHIKEPIKAVLKNGKKGVGKF
jgi:pSer/pThr/pTyr-binding forkhead associated (FHA) protein